MIQVSPHRVPDVLDPDHGARDSILAAWGSRHSPTAPGTVAERDEALLEQIAHGRVSEGSGDASRPGEASLGEDSGTGPEAGGNPGRRSPVSVASGLLVAGARMAFRRLRQRRQRQLEVGPAAGDRVKE
jgi:hypothetical protein